MVKSLSTVLRNRITPRVIGFDDEPFPSRPRQPGRPFGAVGIVTTGTVFDGMLYARGLTQDGMDATEHLGNIIRNSKFAQQLHAVLLDGVTMGGLNVIDICSLASMIQIPVIAVMRHRPDINAVRNALAKLPDADARLQALEAAGEVHEMDGWVFQFYVPSAVPNASAVDVAGLLHACTPAGTQSVPECLRMAHLIGAATVTGQSSSAA